MTNEELSEALFAAFETEDDDAVRRLCSPDLRVRQNGGPTMTLDEVLAFSAAVHGVLKSFRYADPVRSSTPSGFVEEHAVRGTLPDGSELDLAVCVVADVRDGTVIDVREYFDSAVAAGLIQALG